MKDLIKKKFCLGLHNEHLESKIFPHQSNYTEKILKKFYMNKAYQLSSSMLVQSPETKIPFGIEKKNEKILSLEMPYISAIGALTHLTNNIRPDIIFSINLLARYGSSCTQRHENDIRDILRYLHGTVDLNI